MNTNHTAGRTVVRASALTVLLTGLLLGTTGVAVASPNSPRPCLTCAVNTPSAPAPIPVRDHPLVGDAPSPTPGTAAGEARLTASNSGAGPVNVGTNPIAGSSPGSNPITGSSTGPRDSFLSISGAQFGSGDEVEVDVYTSHGSPAVWSGSVTSSIGGGFTFITGCQTAPVIDGGHQFAIARDKGFVSNELPVTVAMASDGTPMCWR
jgi:hypothetical protein